MALVLTFSAADLRELTFCSSVPRWRQTATGNRWPQFGYHESEQLVWLMLAVLKLEQLMYNSHPKDEGFRNGFCEFRNGELEERRRLQIGRVPSRSWARTIIVNNLQAESAWTLACQTRIHLAKKLRYSLQLLAVFAGDNPEMSLLSILQETKIRILQNLARSAPGATNLRVLLHRWRGVNLGRNIWIGYDAIIETSHPEYVTIKDGATIGIRAVIIAHFRELRGVTIEEDVSIGPGAIIMPNVTIGKASVVTAGSVVTTSVPPNTVVQGNPARAIAKVGIPLKLNVSLREFSTRLRPLGRK